MGSPGTSYFSSLHFVGRGLLGYLAYLAIFPVWLSPLLHKMRGVKIAEPFTVYIAPTVLLDTLFPELITIEPEVYLTRGATVISHFNPTDPIKKILGTATITGPVTLKRGAFVGTRSIILPNVTVGECAVVGAGAVVTRDVPDYAVVAGNPARIIGDIRDRGGAGPASG